MAEGANLITKIGIIVISVILGFFMAYNLYEVLTDGRDFGNTDKILAIVQIGFGLTLCVLAFWGAFSENACLCYIALIACAIAFILAVWLLIQCFLDNNYCDTKDYILKSVILVVYGVMVFAVFIFIRSIQ